MTIKDRFLGNPASLTRTNHKPKWVRWDLKHDLELFEVPRQGVAQPLAPVMAIVPMADKPVTDGPTGPISEPATKLIEAAPIARPPTDPSIALASSQAPKTPEPPRAVTDTPRMTAAVEEADTGVPGRVIAPSALVVVCTELRSSHGTGGIREGECQSSSRVRQASGIEGSARVRVLEADGLKNQARGCVGGLRRARTLLPSSLWIRHSSYTTTSCTSPRTEVEDVLDISGVQTYVINSANVLFLSKRPQPRGAGTAAGKAAALVGASSASVPSDASLLLAS
uniref:Uncharacterized protein n=1 Tax=Oryza brachyantha TaxID=4533 RepID=J3L8I0_ORYBR